MPMLSAIGVDNGCVECGTSKKSGKRSCCARGGAWFRNCGDVGDRRFDHTWVEGIQACKDSASLISVATLPHAILRHVRDNVYSLNATLRRNVTPLRTSTSRQGNTFDAGIKDFGDFAGHAKVVVCVYVLFLIAHRQLY